MELSHLPIQTVAIGNIASMGVSIFIAGTKGRRIMTPNTSIMTHQFSAYFAGKSHELMAVGNYYKKLEDQFIKHYVKHTKMTEEEVREILLGPTDAYLSPSDCLKYGICDEIRSPWEHEDTEKSTSELSKSI